MVLPAIAAGIGIIGTIAGFVSSRKAAKAAREQSEEEARFEQLITTEKLRRLGVEERAQFGSKIAQYVGSGVVAATPTLQQAQAATPAPGSVELLLEEQEREYAFERDIIEQAGATRVQQALAGGKAVADRYRYSGIANLGSGLSNALTILAQYKS